VSLIFVFDRRYQKLYLAFISEHTAKISEIVSEAWTTRDLPPEEKVTWEAMARND
jgi:hypothetical protein